MALTQKAIDEVVCFLAGDDTPPLVLLLKNKKNISEFKLAERLNVTVNQVRNMLYRLHKYNLVFFIRKKDKKKGWYIYYWTLHMKNMREVRYDLKKKQLAEFKERLGREEGNNFLVCPNKCSRLTMENALEVDFRCQECGSLMVQQDNSKTIDNIKKRIVELEAELKEEDDVRKEEIEARLKKAKRAANKVEKLKKETRVKKAEERKKIAKKKKAANKKLIKKAKAAGKKPVKKAKAAGKKLMKKASAPKPKKAEKAPEKKAPKKKSLLKRLLKR